jgi:transposase InsO family protein
VHTVIDDHSRMAYAEICSDEKAVTAIGVLRRAVAWFAEHGVTVERVLSDNGSACKSHAWRDACTELRITPKRTRPYRPPDQRQDRAIPPHPRRRLGLRTLL